MGYDESEFQKLKKEVTFLRERLKNLEPSLPEGEDQNSEIAKIEVSKRNFKFLI